MIDDFDFDPRSKRIVLLCRGSTGERWLEIQSSDGEVIHRLSQDYLPFHPRWSPDGAKVAFSGNIGPVYVHDVTTDETTAVFDDPVLKAGFGRWSPGGKHLAFTAYGRHATDRGSTPPPDLFCHELATGRTDRLTLTDNHVDRFPVWSPTGGQIAFHREDLDTVGSLKKIVVYDRQRKTVRTVLEGNKTQHFGLFPWSGDERWFSLSEQTGSDYRIRIVDLSGREVNCPGFPGMEGAFSPVPGSNDLLCIDSGVMVWREVPSARIRATIRLPAGVGVAKELTWHKVAFGDGGRCVYFLGTDHKVYRWEEGAGCAVYAEYDEPVPEFRIEEFTVTASDGLELPAHRLVPVSPRNVAVLWVHGGPGGTLEPTDPWAMGLVREGFEVVRVAYRGTKGFGDDLYRANQGAAGIKDVQDVIDAGIEWQKRFGADRGLAYMGNSYGAYLGLMAAKHPTSPFEFVVATCTPMSLRVLPLRYDTLLPSDPAERERALGERSVPRNVEHIRAPVLLFHGELDTVASTRDVRQLQALINGSGGDCSLVVYSDDTHTLAKHRADIFEKVSRFVGRAA